MATIYDVSKLAGISLATVSRVMNNNTKVSDKTKQKVLDAMQSLGYQPNSIAQSLASSRSNSVGLLVSELHGPFFGTMMSGIESELRKAHKHVIIAAGHSDEEYEKESIEFLLARKCDSLILHVEAVSNQYLIELCQKDTPIILLNRYIPEIKEKCICVDNKYGGYIATKHLIELGHTKLAYIAGPNWKRDSSDRLEGHKQALQEHNLTFDPDLFFEGDYTDISGHQGMEWLIKQAKPFTGLVCANDEMASGAMQMARKKHIHVPEHLSVIGFDNLSFTNYMYPKLTTMENPVNTMGKMSAQWVLNQSYKANFDIQNIFRPELIVRDSTSNNN